MEPMQYLWAFLMGGALCAIGQLLISLTRLTSARILVVYVVAGVILGALGLYAPLLEAGGCGASVPLTGWGLLPAAPPPAPGALRGPSFSAVFLLCWPDRKQNDRSKNHTIHLMEAPLRQQRGL